MSIARTTKWSLQVEIFSDFQVNFSFFFGFPLKRVDARAPIFNSVASDFVIFFFIFFSFLKKKSEKKLEKKQRARKIIQNKFWISLNISNNSVQLKDVVHFQL